MHDHIRLRLSLGDSMDRDIFAPESVLPEKGNNVVAEGISCHNMHRLQLCGRGATVTDPIMHEREQLLVESVPAIEWRPPTACGAEGTVPVQVYDCRLQEVCQPPHFLSVTAVEPASAARTIVAEQAYTSSSSAGMRAEQPRVAAFVLQREGALASCPRAIVAFKTHSSVYPECRPRRMAQHAAVRIALTVQFALVFSSALFFVLLQWFLDGNIGFSLASMTLKLQPRWPSVVRDDLAHRQLVSRNIRTPFIESSKRLGQQNATAKRNVNLKQSYSTAFQIDLYSFRHISGL